MALGCTGATHRRSGLQPVRPRCGTLCFREADCDGDKRCASTGRSDRSRQRERGRGERATQGSGQVRDPTIKRAYGDWTTPNLGGWKDHLHKYAIQPIQQFAYTRGKNSTDSAFIIDAMDLLYAGNVDGFCLVSSDSDFTRLATRLREAGKLVYGLGERKTPEPFIAACDKFIFLEVLKRTAEAAPAVQVQDVPDLKDLLTHAIKETLRDNWWAPLSAVGAFMSKNNASFDPRNYGFTKLGELVRKQPYVEVKEVKEDTSSFVHLHFRMKQ
jgi:NYN domain/OST-HTH/LOTUS domain